MSRNLDLDRFTPRATARFDLKVAALIFCLSSKMSFSVAVFTSLVGIRNFSFDQATKINELVPYLFGYHDGRYLKVLHSAFHHNGSYRERPIFLTAIRNVKKKTKAASYAVGTAALVLFIFLFFGREILSVLRIDFPSLKIAGGIVLTILGIELVLGFSLVRVKYDRSYSPANTLIGTPLLTGPGVIVSMIIFVQEYGYLVATTAAIIALVSSWLILSFSGFISKLLGEFWRETISRITGFLLVAVAIDFIVAGAKAVL